MIHIQKSVDNSELYLRGVPGKNGFFITREAKSRQYVQRTGKFFASFSDRDGFERGRPLWKDI